PPEVRWAARLSEALRREVRKAARLSDALRRKIRRAARTLPAGRSGGPQTGHLPSGDPEGRTDASCREVRSAADRTPSVRRPGWPHGRTDASCREVRRAAGPPRSLFSSLLCGDYVAAEQRDRTEGTVVQLLIEALRRSAANHRRNRDARRADVLSALA